MRRALPAVLLFIAAPALSKGTLSTKQFGGGGGYTHPSAEAGDYLENGARRETPPAPAPNPKPDPVRPPSAPVASAPAAAPSAPAVAGHRAAAPSLWNGLVRPLAAPADAPAGDEQARAAGAAEYDGQAEAPALTDETAATSEGSRGFATSEPGRAGALFVSIELDPGEAGTLRDAVAGLGAAGFSRDHRFEATPGAGRASVVTGWLPASRLAEAVARPGVRRVSIETSARPAARTQTEGAFLIGLRVPDPARPEESLAPALAELARDAGLRERRVLGLETAPDGRVVAVVAGRMPLALLSKALARADVVKLVPAPASGSPSLLMPTPPTPGGFARFMAKRGLWLVLLTLAVGLLPSARAGVGRGLSALIPYH